MATIVVFRWDDPELVELGRLPQIIEAMMNSDAIPNCDGAYAATDEAADAVLAVFHALESAQQSTPVPAA